MTAHLFSKLLLAVAAAGLASCASHKGPEISKVHYYKLDAKKNITSADPAIPFEQKFRLYGAVNNEEMLERNGTYYDVHWSVPDRNEPVKVKFEYRQSLTGSKVYTMETDVTNVRRENTTEFAVTGEPYRTNGHITAWKVSLVRGKDELAAHRSYLWQ